MARARAAVGKICGSFAMQLSHTDGVSIDVVVRQVSELLTRSHALFGDPPTSCRPAAAHAEAHLADAGQHVHTSRGSMTHASGRLADGHRLFTDTAHAGISALAGSDEELGARLERAAGADRHGRAASAAVVHAAATDVTALAPLRDTPAGQHALLSALRARVAQQQSIVEDTKTRAGAAAAGLRALTYPRAQPATRTTPGS